MTSPKDEFLEIAAQCWCDPKVSNRVMDVELGIVFAQALRNLASQKDEEIKKLKEENKVLRTLDDKTLYHYIQEARKSQRDQEAKLQSQSELIDKLKADLKLTEW